MTQIAQRREHVARCGNMNLQQLQYIKVSGEIIYAWPACKPDNFFAFVLQPTKYRTGT